MDKVIRYGAVQRKLHWIVLLLVVQQYVLQGPMRDAMQNLTHSGTLGAIGFLVTTLHTWGGAVIGLIMVYRIWLRWQRPVPVGAGGLRPWSSLLALVVHWSFYVVLLFMACTGVLQYYFEWEPATQWHRWGKWLLLALIVVHVLAALLHRFYKKDAVMGQMWGSGPPH